MSTIGSMRSFGTDTHAATKSASTGNSRLGGDNESAMTGFDALMASLVSPAPAQPIAQTDTPQQEAMSDGPVVEPSAVADQRAAIAETLRVNHAASAISEISAPHASAAVSEPAASGGPVGQAASSASTPPTIAVGQDIQLPTPHVTAQDGVPGSDAISNAAGIPQTDGVQGDAFQTQLAALFDGNDVTHAELGKGQTPAAPIKPSGAPTVLSPNQIASQNAADEALGPQAQTQTADAGVVAQPQINTAAATPAHKPANAQDTGTSQASKATDAGPILLDSGSTQSTAPSTEAALPNGETASRPTQLTPQTIPMLAATMMRRLDSGSKQFSMRLDPPELGQVEVKLTVDADKKVRAVVSADRPEALADLVRSARELTRALHDAGLNLEENGLTFTLNDPAGDRGQNQNGQSQAHTDRKQSALDLVSNQADLADADTSQTVKGDTPQDPFQIWQRARIALTA
jgi:flagellar hook-length control protein FliK